MLAEGNRSLIMVASTKGGGHYIWTSGNPLERAKDMVFGKGAGGEVVRISYVRETGELERVGKRRDKPQCAWFMTNWRQWVGES